MQSQDIRRGFLEFFKKKGHTIVPSSPVVPHDDPTLLFTNSGMNQFKDVFLGSGKRDYTRAATTQKCVRVGGKHNDLDNVGHTSRHLTFFEMLGNFSFGDYFKKEAIAFAWEAIAEVYQFDPQFLWVTVFEDDDEAFELWKAHISEDRIVRMGEKDNFWAMGDTGPCGPCSEIYYDKGEKYGSGRSPAEDPSGERYIEFWNLVFMQFNRDPHGKMASLPNKSIDTGSGLERVVSLKMGVDHVFHTDILRYLIDQTASVLKKTYDPKDAKLAPAFHVIADHIRSLSFAIADGAQPSNVERGYVLRKLLRRAVRYGRTLLGAEEPFLVKLVPGLVEKMGDDFPELKASKGRIEEILALEEEGFLRTLKRGGNILSTVVEKALQSPFKQISGEDAFKLKDTYGFPLEEVLLIAKDSGLEVNLDSYQILEEKAKELSRASRDVASQQVEESLFATFAKNHPPCAFVGYTEHKIESEILGIVENGEFVELLSEGSEGLLILKQTPFYAEKGGQVADIGVISNANARMRIVDCQNPYPNVIVHRGKVELGVLNVGDKVTAAIDEGRRQNIAAHHTATHLLHWALQQTLGEHIRQAGSLVEADRLRFDFNHHKPLSPEDITQIEDLVNAKIRENQSVSTYEIPFQEAQNRPEVKQFFGEKYGSHVRVVDISFSKELCGGTHASHVGMIGYFRILKEGSIASGVRRIEAACGKVAEQFVRQKENQLNQAAHLLKTKPAQLDEKIEQLLNEMSDLKVKLKNFKRDELHALAKMLAQKQVENLVAQKVDIDPEDLAELGDLLMQQIKSGVIALAVCLPKRVQLTIQVTPDLVAKGISAGELIKEVAPHIQGGGGGRPTAAQAGGKRPEGVDAVFETLKNRLQV